MMLYILKNNISLTFKLLIMGAKQIGWSNESNLLWDILNKINKLGGAIANLVTAATPKYKVYTALLTQSGGDDTLGLNTGSLTIGVTYSIENVGRENYDFTNVGAPNNNPLTKFVATNITPNSWGTGGSPDDLINYNPGAPVVTVLENTIGNIWWSYDSVGGYSCNSDGLFTPKTWNINVILLGTGGPAYRGVMYLSDQNRIGIQTELDVDSPSDGLLYNTPIEIRVYN